MLWLFLFINLQSGLTDDDVKKAHSAQVKHQVVAPKPGTKQMKKRVTQLTHQERKKIEQWMNKQTSDWTEHQP